MKNKILKILMIVGIAVVVIAVLIFLLTFVFPLKCKGSLKKYQSSSGGGMQGGFEMTTIRAYDEDHAVLSTSKKEWYHQIPVTSEYLIDAKCLSDIEDIFYKYRIKGWEKYPKSPVQVMDADTTSYSFGFPEDYYSYSTSQMTPVGYTKAADAINSTIEGYMKTAVPMPQLVNHIPENAEALYEPVEGETGAYVVSYVDKVLTLRILNGTEDDIEYGTEYTITKNKEVIVSAKSGWNGWVNAGQYKDKEFNLSDYLEAGSYILEFDSFSVPFELQ